MISAEEKIFKPTLFSCPDCCKPLEARKWSVGNSSEVQVPLHYGSEQPDSETSKFKLSQEREVSKSKLMSAAKRVSEASKAEQANE